MDRAQNEVALVGPCRCIGSLDLECGTWKLEPEPCYSCLPSKSRQEHVILIPKYILTPNTFASSFVIVTVRSIRANLSAILHGIGIRNGLLLLS